MSPATAHRCAAPERGGLGSQTAAPPASSAEKLIAANTFRMLATGRRISHALADAEHVDKGLIDRIVLVSEDDTQLTIRAHIVPFNGRPTSAALLVETAEDPFNSTTLDALADALTDALTGSTVARVEVTVHPNTQTPYAVLVVLQDQRQITIEAQALPAAAGSPQTMFYTLADASAADAHGAPAALDGNGQLSA
jgi:hypothetical protein